MSHGTTEGGFGSKLHAIFEIRGIAPQRFFNKKKEINK
jgi:hypothetical protein